MNIDKLLAYFQRGVLTESETWHRIVDAMSLADCDEEAMEIWHSIPDSFRSSSCDWLLKMAESDFDYRICFIGDRRSAIQIEEDAVRRQQLLQRLSPEMMKDCS